ncbi:hypothetical protein BGW80DRAFT_1275493, partial [Lactifluus volemus]
GLGIAFVLLQEQQKLVGTDSATAAAYGFQPTAIVHSIPYALFVWALLLFAIQATGVAIWIVLHPREKTPSLQDTTVSIPVPPPSSTLGKDQQAKVEAMV